MIIHILTRCTRTNNLLKIKDSIFKSIIWPFTETRWHILFDTSSLKDINVDILEKLQNDNIILRFYKGSKGDYASNLNKEIDTINSDEWIYVLDDDNILHENFYSEVDKIHKLDPNAKGIIFSQRISSKDFSGLDIRKASVKNIKVGSIDNAQFLLRKDIIGDVRYRLNEYKCDGYFIEEVYNKHPELFSINDIEMCYYNHIQSNKMPISLPRILLMGEDISELKSTKYLSYEEDKLIKKFIPDEKNLNIELSKFDPDAIVTIGKLDDFNILNNQSLDFRSRWIHFNEKTDQIGNSSYNCSMYYMLNGHDENTPLISFFTPFFNTGDKLNRTYNSLKDQIYNNWEWVLVNDSNDEGRTLKIAEKIAENDPRVKIYDFRTKSGGIIGESKYRAASLCKGKYIMELDHDDCLTNDAGDLMVKAFKSYPDCKFVYSDCAEIDENHNSMKYPDGFCFGYGSYYKETYNGIEYDVSKCTNINPITIRHIVGVPNHFRAWDKDFYMSIGGHNRRLTISDDYELIIRSFLKTKFVRIPKLCYLQFFHNSGSLNNTQDSSRADIQRRVRTISNFYNKQINQRFIELGIEDWAYNQNPQNPIISTSKFDNEEGAANYVMNISNPNIEITKTSGFHNLIQL